MRLRASALRVFSEVARVAVPERVSVNGLDASVVHSPEVVCASSGGARTLLVVETGGGPRVYRVRVGGGRVEVSVPLPRRRLGELGVRGGGGGGHPVLYVEASHSGAVYAGVQFYVWDGSVGAYVAGGWVDVGDAEAAAAVAEEELGGVAAAAEAAARRNAARAVLLLSRDGVSAVSGLVEPVRVWSETSGLAWRGATRHLALRRAARGGWYSLEAVDTWAGTRRLELRAVPGGFLLSVEGAAAGPVAWAAAGTGRGAYTAEVAATPSGSWLLLDDGAAQTEITEDDARRALAEAAPAISATVTRLATILALDKALKTTPPENIPEKLVKRGATHHPPT